MKKGVKKKALTHSLQIGDPTKFRQICAIVDADFLPETVRRVKLLKHTSDEPLGFYIRDGITTSVTHEGSKKVPGIFISRLVPGGLAEGTGLLAVNDEVQEINGIEMKGRSLDEVTDMMIANGKNLVITVVPALPPPSNSLIQHRSSTRISKTPISDTAKQSLSKSCDNLICT